MTLRKSCAVLLSTGKVYNKQIIRYIVRVTQQMYAVSFPCKRPKIRSHINFATDISYMLFI